MPTHRSLRLVPWALAATLAGAAPIRGPLPQVLDALAKRGAEGATVSSLTLTWDSAGCEGVLQTQAGGACMPLAAATALVLEVLNGLPDDCWLESLQVSPRTLKLLGRSTSFEAVNLFRTRLARLEGGWARRVPVPEARKEATDVLFSFDIDLIDVGLASAAPDPRLLARVKATARQPRQPSRPPASYPSAEVRFKGRILMAGKVSALCLLPDGRTLMAGIGFRFADAEVVAIEAEGVRLKQLLPGDRVFLVRFARES